MTATSISMTDDVLREIGEQVSLTLRKRLPKWGNTPLDLTRGIDLYHNRVGTFGNLQTVRRNRDGSKNRSDIQVSGKTFETLDTGAKREEGKDAYTTDELGKLYEKDPDDPVFKKHPKLRDLAKTNHPQTDGVVVLPDGKIETYQHKLYTDPIAGVRAFMKDENNDRFVVPSDQFNEYIEVLDKRIKNGGPESKRAKNIKRKLEKSEISSDSANRPFSYISKASALDASKRIGANVAVGVASDLAVFVCGGAAWEIRDAYRNPGAMSLLERCKRLILTIWERLREILKDRSLREIGSEVIALVGGALTAQLQMVRAAATKIVEAVEALRRVWMEFVSGKIRTLSDLVAAFLKAVFTAVIVAGVALPLEAKLTSLMVAIPLGDVLASVITAAVVGVMIVVSNRSIDSVVRALFGIFNAGTIARLHREEIQKMCEEAIPRLIEDRERLQALVDNHFAEREVMLDATFEDMQFTRGNHDFNGFLKSLITLNQAYGKMLPWENFEEFEEFMLDDSRTLKF